MHRGNGTAPICADDPSVLPFSIHGTGNFPLLKEVSDLDIELPDRTGDGEYLHALERGICHALSAEQPELAIHLAGADPYSDDRLGRLALTKEGPQMRDGMAIDTCRAASVPAAIAMAGGYARNVFDTVDIHFAIVGIAAQRWRDFRCRSHMLSASI